MRHTASRNWSPFGSPHFPCALKRPPLLKRQQEVETIRGRAVTVLPRDRHARDNVGPSLPSALQSWLSDHPHRLALGHRGRGHDIQHDAAEGRANLGLWIAEEVGQPANERTLLYARPALD